MHEERHLTEDIAHHNELFLLYIEYADDKNSQQQRMKKKVLLVHAYVIKLIISLKFSTSGHSDAQPCPSECPDVKNYSWWLNPVWHRMLSSCTHMATVGVKGLRHKQKTLSSRTV